MCPVRTKRQGVPHPPVFLSKSAQSLENMRVKFLLGAKKRKRVRKRMKRKDLPPQLGRGERGEQRKTEYLPPTPHYMHEYQKKGLAEIAIRN